MLIVMEIDSNSFDGSCTECPFCISSLTHTNPQDINSPIEVVYKCYNTDMIITKYINNKEQKRPKHLCPIKAKISGDISSISDL